MPGKIPNPIWIFRIVHEQNLRLILQYGMVTRNHPDNSIDYVFVGDTHLTNDRHMYPVRLEGYGNLGDYVPFYFGPLSPMLLNIKTGYRGIIKRPQSEIIYICCKIDSIIRARLRFFFTDGHATDRISEHYHSLEKLDQVDWDVVKERYWRNNEHDVDRQRRKQAEFLVYQHVPSECVDAIVVFDQEKADFVNDLLNQLKLAVRVHINPKGNFYYQ